MSSPRRIARLCSLIQARIAEVLTREIRDPRLGLVTIQRIELDREVTKAKVYWSVIGDDKERRRSEVALQNATRFIQREVAAIMPTRNTPRLEFIFDESIAGAIRIQELLRELRTNEQGPQDSGAEPSEQDGTAGDDTAGAEQKKD